MPGSEQEEFPRSSKKYYIIKKILSLLKWISTNKKLARWASAITGSYYLVLDIWSDKLAFIKDYPKLHQILFWICLLLSLGILVIRTYYEDRRDNDTKLALNFLTDFIGTVGYIVEAKINRFRKKFVSLKPKSNKLNQITQPDDQLEIIAHSFCEFLKKSFGFEDHQINITILKRKDSASKWNYCFKYQKNWEYTDPSKILPKKIETVEAIKRGEYVFYPDKMQAAQKGKYFLSDRDIRRRTGSAFLFPIKIQGNNCLFEYLICIITYGKQFCEETDEPSVQASKAILREICRRFELELCLKAIKEYN